MPKGLCLRGTVRSSDGQFLIGVSDPVDEKEPWHGAMPIGWVQRKRIQCHVVPTKWSKGMCYGLGRGG